LPLLILHAVTRKPVFVCEAHRKRGIALELRHCFSPTKLSEAKPVLRPWRSMPHTVTAYCQLPKGTATLVNSGIGDKILISARAGIRVVLDDVDEDMINEMICIGNIQKTCWNAYLTIESIPDLIPPDIGTPEQNPTSPIEEDTPVGVRVYIFDYGVGLENATLEYSTDNGSSWNPITMSYNGTYDKWEATIPGQPAETAVQYKIVAFDLAENMQVADNAGSYYVYSVVPEYTMLLPLLFMTATLIAFALTRTRKKP